MTTSKKNAESAEKAPKVVDKNIYAQLSEPFPPEVERTLVKSGTSLTYIPVSEVITRLNKVIGIDKWNYRIVECKRDALDPDFIVAHVTMDVVFVDADGATRWVQRDGFGGQKIKRTRNGDIVDLGDEMKGAVSDALKKAAQTFGVGLYLARTEEAMSIEQAESAPKVDPEIEKKWDNFVANSKSLSADKRSQLNNFWNEYSGGMPKPTKATATLEQLDALNIECVRLMLDGVAVMASELENDD
jgi:hypothetical protein